MAFGSQEAAIAGLMLFAGLARTAEIRFDVRHDHWRGSAPGVLTADSEGLRYEERGDHNRAWKWTDVQQLLVEPKRVHLLTYSDNRWKLGADREYTFILPAEGTFADLVSLAKSQIGVRAVSSIPAPPAQPLWEIPAKLKQKFGGSEGTLAASAGSIVYTSPEKGESRTWLLEDIDNISAPDPYTFTITTFERSKLDYGSRRSFHFQLKQRLTEPQYNELWRRLNPTILEKQSQ